MSSDRAMSAESDPDDAVVEGALRPTTLAEFIGQDRVKSQLGLVLEAAGRRSRPADHVLLSGPPGLDSQGRFIGRNDIERGLAFFFSHGNRRGSAPIVRGDAVFGRGGPLAHQAHHGSRGVPRSLAKSGLDFTKLRDIHARYANGTGEAKAVLAREYEVSVNVVTFHLRPSCSMRAALAEQPPAPISNLRSQISDAPLAAPCA